MIDTIIQAGILIFGASGIWVVGRKEPWARWGFVLGLCGQPFWFALAWRGEHWGVLVLAVWYSYSWGQGIWNHWVRP